MDGLLEAIRSVRSRSPVPVIGFAGGPFTLAAYLVEGHGARDARRLREWLVADEPVATRLLDALADATAAYLEAQVDAGAQALQLFDSWIGALGPAAYVRFVAPSMRRLAGRLRALGVPIVAFGTGTAGLLDEFAAATGAHVVGLDWRVALDAAWTRVPDRAVQGNLDPCVLLGPWPDIEREARRILAEAGGRAGHVFNLGHGVLPDTDPEALRRLVELVHEVSAHASASADPSASVAVGANS